METNGMQIKENNQYSQGGLIEHEPPLSFGTLEEKIEEVSIHDIQHFTIVPDYVTPTDSKYPFVVMTPSSTNCIDGWNLVERAKVEGKSVVTCNVEHIADHSDEELAIRKVALRLKPRGGTGSYAETIRNTKFLLEILLGSKKDLKVFHHGGDRKGEGFINNRDENVRKVLSFRLGKSVTTINQYLNHARFLNEETLNFFAAQKVEKDFFQEGQSNKRGEINRMTGEERSGAEITIQISNDMRKWYEEYLHSNKIKPTLGTRETGAEAESHQPELQTPQKTVPRVTNPEVFRPWYGNVPADEEDSVENVKRDIDASGQRLREIATLTDIDQIEKDFNEELRHICRIPQRVSALKSTRIGTDSYQEEVLQ